VTDEHDPEVVDPVGRERETAEAVSRLVLSGLFTLPLVGNVIAHLLGFEFFLLADPKLQFFWGSVVQFGAGWRLYVGAFRNLRQGRAGTDLLVVVGTSAAYGYSVYATFFTGGAAHVYFAASAVLLTVANLMTLLAAIAKRRTSRAIK